MEEKWNYNVNVIQYNPELRNENVPQGMFNKISRFYFNELRYVMSALPKIIHDHYNDLGGEITFRVALNRGEENIFSIVPRDKRIHILQMKSEHAGLYLEFPSRRIENEFIQEASLIGAGGLFDRFMRNGKMIAELNLYNHYKLLPVIEHLFQVLPRHKEGFNAVIAEGKLESFNVRGQQMANQYDLKKQYFHPALDDALSQIIGIPLHYFDSNQISSSIFNAYVANHRKMRLFSVDFNYEKSGMVNRLSFECSEELLESQNHSLKLDVLLKGKHSFGHFSSVMAHYDKNLWVFTPTDNYHEFLHDNFSHIKGLSRPTKPVSYRVEFKNKQPSEPNHVVINRSNDLDEAISKLVEIKNVLLQDYEGTNKPSKIVLFETLTGNEFMSFGYQSPNAEAGAGWLLSINPHNCNDEVIKRLNQVMGTSMMNESPNGNISFLFPFSIKSNHKIKERFIKNTDKGKGRTQ